MIMWNEKGGAFAAQGKRRNKHVHLFVSIGDKSMSLLPTGNITKKETRKNKEVRGW